MKMKADVKAEIWLWASAFCYNMEKMVDIMLERGRKKMRIRQAGMEQLDEIMGIYGIAQKFMAENGNPGQWGTNYPSRERIQTDIEKGQCYVAEDEDGIQGVFVFFIGTEPNYEIIEQGDWIRKDRPYGVLHRIASAGRKKGVASFCIQWCLEKSPNMRGDTHEKNHVMQHVLEKNGLIRCGIIHVEDGTARIAYQTEKGEKEEQ